MPAPPPIKIISASVSLAKKSPKGPKIVRLSPGFKLNRYLYTHDIEGCPQLIDSVYLTPTSKDPYNPYEIMCERNLGKYTHPKLVKIMAKAEKSNKWYKNRIGPTCNWRNWTNKFDWFGPMN